jgi:hypothetical protein
MNENRGWLEYSAGDMLMRYTNEKSTEMAVNTYIQRLRHSLDCDLICFTAIARIYQLHVVVLGENMIWGTAIREPNQTDQEYIDQAESVWYFFQMCLYKPGYRPNTGHAAHTSHPKSSFTPEEGAIDLTMWKDAPPLSPIHMIQHKNENNTTPPDLDQAETDNSPDTTPKPTARRSKRLQRLQPESAKTFQNVHEKPDIPAKQKETSPQTPRRSSRLKTPKNPDFHAQPSTSRNQAETSSKKQKSDPKQPSSQDSDDSSDSLDYDVATPPKSTPPKSLRKGKLPKCPKRNRDGMFKCKFCEHTSKFPSRWKIHIATHFEQRFNCPAQNCEASFKVEGDRDRHHYNYHQDPSVFKCTKCEYTTPSRKLFLHHENAHDKKLKCPKCDYFTNDKSNMNKHFRKYHA